MGDWQLDLVRSVLDSSDWVAYVQDFTATHHRKWARRTRQQRREGKYSRREGKSGGRTDTVSESKVGGYSHAQYELFREFSQKVEAMVSGKLAELGVSDDDFFATCEELVQSESRGPREEMFKETVRQLLSYSSFSSFCEMMQRAYDDLEGESPGNAAGQQQQHQSAFARSAVLAAQQQQNEDYELQLALAESKREAEEAKIQQRVRRQQAALGRGAARNGAGGGGGGSGSGSGGRSGGGSVQASSRADGSAVPPEWDVQVATAQSIVNASKLGKLSPAEDEVFVPWAEKVVELNEDYQRLSMVVGNSADADADADGGSGSSGGGGGGGGGLAAAETRARIQDKVQELNLLRLKVDLLVAQQMTKENEQRRHELNRKVEAWHEEMVSNAEGGGSTQQEIIQRAEATLDDLCARVASVHAEVGWCYALPVVLVPCVAGHARVREWASE